MARFETNRVDYGFGLASERAPCRARSHGAGRGRAMSREERSAGAPLQGLHLEARSTAGAAGGASIAKAEWTQGRSQSALHRHLAQAGRGDRATLYEDIYCARGDMENRIKECQLDLFADRTSAATLRVCFIGHGLMENRHGLLVDACLTLG